MLPVTSLEQKDTQQFQRKQIEFEMDEQMQVMYRIVELQAYKNIQLRFGVLIYVPTYL